MAPASIVSAADTLGSAESIGSHETDEFAAGSGLGGALRLLASVIEVPGGVSIKGGRPSQAGVQIGASTLTDPVLGLVHFTLPDDAIDSVAVLPNPYAVEYGRFSSGLVVIQTRRGGDAWHVRLNNLTRRSAASGTRISTTSTASPASAPHFELGGPLVKDRLFLEQTAQYRYSSDDVPSRPEDELRTTQWFSSFTRVDANLSPRHSLVGTGGFFPSVTTMATLGTFTPPDATVDMHERVTLGTVTERALWSDALVSETTVQVHGYRRVVQPQGTAPMQLLPETTLGNFFNTQHRIADDVSVDSDRVGIGEGTHRAAPVQGRPRPAAQQLRRHQRQPAGADRAIERHARAPARLRPGRRRRCCAGPTSRSSPRTACSRTRAGTSSSAPGSIATASSAAGTSRRGSARRCC